MAEDQSTHVPIQGIASCRQTDVVSTHVCDRPSCLILCLLQGMRCTSMVCFQCFPQPMLELSRLPLGSDVTGTGVHYPGLYVRNGLEEELSFREVTFVPTACYAAVKCCLEPALKPGPYPVVEGRGPWVQSLMASSEASRADVSSMDPVDPILMSRLSRSMEEPWSQAK
jgi:hypothetical protein